MTTDLLTLGKTEHAAVAGSILFQTPVKKRGLFGHTASLLRGYSHEIDGWNRKMNAVLSYLNQTQQQLSVAEEKIIEQQQRIALLEGLATTDDLTGLKNRRGFHEAFQRELECCDRGLSCGGMIIMIDLDHFKSINDTYGHAAGDAVLRLVAGTLANEVRKMDVAARLGGDEFVLLLSNTVSAHARADVIAQHLNNLSLAWNGEIIPVQASTGAQVFGAGDTAENILHAADGTLYARKFARRHPTDTTEGATA